MDKTRFYLRTVCQHMHTKRHNGLPLTVLKDDRHGGGKG